MDRRSIQDVYLKTEQSPYTHILTLNLLSKASHQAERKRNYRDLESSHAQSVQIAEGVWVFLKSENLRNVFREAHYRRIEKNELSLEKKQSVIEKLIMIYVKIWANWLNTFYMMHS